MKIENNRAMAKKKIYNQPKTEITQFETETLLQGLVLSTNSGGGPGRTDAPKRGDIIP